MRKIVVTLLASVLCFALLSGLSFSAATVEDFTAGTAGSVITLLPADGTPSETPDPSSGNPFAINTTHGVTYWNFGGGGNGRSVSYVFDAPAAGDYYLGINYNSKNARTLIVTVNGGNAQTLSFVQNSTEWGDNADSSKVNWNHHIVKVTLAEGRNSLALAMNGNSGAPMFSDLKLWPASEWLTVNDGPTVESASAVGSASGFDGTGYDVGSDLGSVTWDVNISVPGTYKFSVAYSTSSGVAYRPIEVTANGTVVASMSRAKNSTAYGNGWSFVTSDEVHLDVGTTTLGMQVSGSSWIGALRAELVKSDLPEDDSRDVFVIYEGLQDGAAVYSLDLNWENSDFSFDYVAGAQGAWNPADHTYGETSGAGWEDDDLTVTVVNHSNAAVKVTMNVTDGDPSDGLIVKSDKGEVTLPTAEGTLVANAPKEVYTLTIEGTPSAAVEKVATATVTFAAGE